MNKTFKVIWEVNVEREEVEQYMKGEFSERDVQDWVFFLSEKSMESCSPHEARWVDENGEDIKLERKIIYRNWEERLEDMPNLAESAQDLLGWGWDEEEPK